MIMMMMFVRDGSIGSGSYVCVRLCVGGCVAFF
jgi:hypothetical protein